MNIYFDTLDNEMAYTIKRFVEKYNVENIYTVTDPALGISREMINSKCCNKVKYFFDRQKLYLANLDDSIYYDRKKLLDTNILREMEEYDAEILKMLERNVYQKKDFDSRIKAYHEYLEYFYTFLDVAKIDIAIFCFPPHSVWDYMIYRLSPKKGIITAMASLTPIVTKQFCYFCSDFVIDEKKIEDRVKYWIENNNRIVLSESMHTEAARFSKSEGHVVNVKKTASENYSLHDKVSYLKWLLKSKQKYTGKKITDYIYEKRRLIKLKNVYRKLSVEPDYNKKYIYFPLHYEPEMAICPLGGVFVYQYLAIQLLAHYISDEERIYVKEHPLTFEWAHTTRNINFYSQLLKNRKIKLINIETDTIDLIDHSIAVASITGTAGYEAGYRGKPFLMFGETVLKYAPWVYPIRNNEDCEDVVKKVRDIRENLPDFFVLAFLKVMDEISRPVKFSDVFEEEREDNTEQLFWGYSQVIDREIDRRQNGKLHSNG